MVASIPKKLPLLFIGDDVLLPGSSLRIPATTSMNKNMVKSRLLSQNTLSSIIIGVITKSVDGEDSLEIRDLVPTIGTAAVVVQVTSTNWPQPAFTLLVTGLCRFRLEKIIMEEPYPVGVVVQLDPLRNDGPPHTDKEENEELNSLIKDFRTVVLKLVNLLDPSPVVNKLKKMLDTFPIQSLVDLCASVVSASFNEKLDVLNAVDLAERIKIIIPLLLRRIQGLEMDENQKTNKLDVFHTRPINVRYRIGGGRGHSAGVDDDDLTDIAELQERLKKAKLPPHADAVAKKELRRLKNLGPFSPENGTIRSYVELLADLPWQVSSPEVIDVTKARQDLDADHYAMDKLKRRVLEYLAVRQLKNDLKGPILCFVGPPGVGKTSIGRSIADTLGRQFHRISLGGVSNQSDIRGHRRTYVGAMPGRIIQAIKNTGVNNPVILLDEIDKMGYGIHGDPASALLEVLDPEQNSHFVDHYLNMPFDLSQVLFIATANFIDNIPLPLYDRLEIINIQGYTREEKSNIAVRHLLPKLLREHGLDDTIMTVPLDSIKFIISSYTMEGGVRSLERKLSALCRAVAVKVAEHRRQDSPRAVSPSGSDDENNNSVSGDLSEDKPRSDQHWLELHSEPPQFPIVLDEVAVEDILGPPSFDNGISWMRLGIPGIAVGLAFNGCGGEITVVECSKVPKTGNNGTGKLLLTGKLGDVMKESAKLALNWVRINGRQLKLALPNVDECRDPEGSPVADGDAEICSTNGHSQGLDIARTDVHIHFPAGSICKDGPSAGITIATALVSLFADLPVAADLAMTGELTLRGVVLPIGGVKEKVLAAYRRGFTRVILPKFNEKDLPDIPEEAKNTIKFVFVETMEDVLRAAFNGSIAIAVPKTSAPLTSKL